MLLTGSGYPPFWQMYGMVTVIGFFPITVGVFIAEQRRLKRNLAHARTLNAQLDKLHQPAPAPTGPTLPQGVMLTAENGTEQPRRLPNLLVYSESVGNYVDVHWLNLMFPQQTVLRSTLKDMEAAFSRPSAVFSLPPRLYCQPESGEQGRRQRAGVPDDNERFGPADTGIAGVRRCVRCPDEYACQTRPTPLWRRALHREDCSRGADAGHRPAGDFAHLYVRVSASVAARREQFLVTTVAEVVMLAGLMQI